MSKVYILRGIPASGKTTKAKEIIRNNPGTKRVNRDDLRKMLDFGEYSEKNEVIVKSVEKCIVWGLLNNDISVIIDDINIKDTTIEDWMEFLFSNNVTDDEIEIIWMNTPLQECIDRDVLRQESVGENVIRVMYEQKQLNVTSSK